MYIDVLVEYSVNKIFTYYVNKKENIKIGIRVLVPFNNREIEGFILKIHNNKPDYETKEIIKVIDQDVVLNNELLELGKDMSNKYLTTLISCYQVMLPKALKAKHKTNINKKIITFVKLKNKDYIGNLKQNEIINKLKENDISLTELNKISSSSVKTLLKKDIISLYEIEEYRKKYDLINYPKHKLNKYQEESIKRIKSTDKLVSLLYGITGSGKTEIYMELIEEALKENKTAIMLVPEISLTKQITDRFISRFGNTVAVLHSRLSDGERYDEYRRITKKEVKIVIGARSAIFAPLENIKYIIIDECHTDSFKQENNPKYHALEIAELRKKYHRDLKIIIGSATPSLESYARGLKNVYNLVSLEHRANNKELPKVELVDMNKEQKKGNKLFSKILISELETVLKNKEQAIILLNRRGYSSFITCNNCGYVEKCPNCDISLTYHKTSNTLRCHYCGYGTKLNSKCPSCHEESINNLGIGTEKVEEELKKIFKQARIIRMDLDTTSKKGSHDKIIESFRNHEYDILLGTQMIAKGLDFELVTLVGVINGDTSLNIPDFRSSEKTYQLLEQVAGRSGRNEKDGLVIIQTYNVDHPVYQYIKNHNYKDFFNNEMIFRKKLNYSPYYYLVGIKIMSKDYDMARDISNKVSSYLRNNLKNSIVLGPSVASVFRINNTYRFQIIIKYKKEENLYQVMEKINNHYLNNTKVKIDIDFNPIQI